MAQRRKGRPSRGGRLGSADAGEVAPSLGMTLSQLAARVGHAVPFVDGSAVPSAPASVSRFRFGNGARGVYDASTGSLNLVAFETVKGLVTLVSATDESFEREFGSMVPPPRTSDLRGTANASVAAKALGPGSVAVGEGEIVVRMDVADFLASIPIAGDEDKKSW